MRSLRYITTEPPNASVAMERMDGTPLRQAEMYMRNNFSVPASPPTAFEIKMPGDPVRIVGIDELDSYQPVEITTVMECAGNGRILMTPIPDGTPWDLGGSSIVTARGVRLNDVLGVIRRQVCEVVFTGADRGPVEPDGMVNYQFSLGRELATSPTPLLVTHIGDEPLTVAHGAPVRLMVPGHYAMKSVKWVTRIEGVGTPFDGHFVNKYRYYGDVEEPEAKAVAEIQVRSVISSPSNSSVHDPGMVVVRGSAWTGFGKIANVEISIDDTSWQRAHTTEVGRGVVKWDCEVHLLGGSHTIRARASDTAGNDQPVEPRWNAGGYANNICQQIEVLIR